MKDIKRDITWYSVMLFKFVIMMIPTVYFAADLIAMKMI